MSTINNSGIYVCDNCGKCFSVKILSMPTKAFPKCPACKVEWKDKTVWNPILITENDLKR